MEIRGRVTSRIMHIKDPWTRTEGQGGLNVGGEVVQDGEGGNGGNRGQL